MSHSYSPLAVPAWVASDAIFPRELKEKLKRIVNIDIINVRDFGSSPIIVEERSFHEFCRLCLRRQTFPEPAFLLVDPIQSLTLVEGWWLYFNQIFHLPWYAATLGDKRQIEEAEKTEYPEFRKAVEALRS